MKAFETDVLVVGSGSAGVIAASKAARMGCRVLLTSKVSIKSGNSTFVGGGWLIPSGDFSPDDYFRFVMEGGKQINDAKLVQILAQRGESMVKALRELGIPLERTSDQYWYIKRGASKSPGNIFMEGLMQGIRDEKITALPWTTIMELLMDEGQISGALGLSKKEGMLIINAKSVVLATGGAGNIYKRNDNYSGILGDGYSLALRAGLPVKDMEFVQFYPFGLAEPNMPSVIIYPPIPDDARIINSKGEDLYKKYSQRFHEYGINTNRDEFTLFLTRELEKDKIYLDYTQIPAEKWEKWFESRLVRMDSNFRTRPFSVAPVAHFFMGGIEIDEHAQTKIPGLFAAGEVTAGVHGANREGGNALTECVVFGDIAGESAAQYALSASKTKVAWESLGRTYLWKNRTEEEINLLEKLRELTWNHAGPIRNAKSLGEGLCKISEMEKILTGLEGTGNSVRLNEIKSGLLVAKAVITASLERKESRGAFYREDFPEMDEANWRKSILLKLDRETLDFVVSH